MDSISFGGIIRSLREQKGLSVANLARGICTEAEMLDFERDIKSPTVEQLCAFTERLNVEITYFFQLTNAGIYNYVAAVYNLINRFKRNRDYAGIYEIVKRERDNPAFEEPKRRQFMEWHEGICLYHIEGKKDEALHTMLNAIRLTNPIMESLTEREIEILTSIAIIESKTENYKKAISYFKEALLNARKLPHMGDIRVKLRVLYGLSQALTESEEYDESLTHCYRGIDLCISYESLYLFGEFHYQVGENCVKMGEKPTGVGYLESAVQLFMLQKNEKYADLVQKEMDKLLSE
jgi:transcriptional regulator with XRE-family HTH domain